MPSGALKNRDKCNINPKKSEEKDDVISNEENLLVISAKLNELNLNENFSPLPTALSFRSCSGSTLTPQTDGTPGKATRRAPAKKWPVVETPTSRSLSVCSSRSEYSGYSFISPRTTPRVCSNSSLSNSSYKELNGSYNEKQSSPRVQTAAAIRFAPVNRRISFLSGPIEVDDFNRDFHQDRAQFLGLSLEEYKTGNAAKRDGDGRSVEDSGKKDEEYVLAKYSRASSSVSSSSREEDEDLWTSVAVRDLVKLVPDEELDRSFQEITLKTPLKLTSLMPYIQEEWRSLRPVDLFS